MLAEMNLEELVRAFSSDYSWSFPRGSRRDVPLAGPRDWWSCDVGPPDTRMEVASSDSCYIWDADHRIWFSDLARIEQSGLVRKRCNTEILTSAKVARDGFRAIV